jgi:ArsR family transcriptional regulator, arsenate/arsenite/antimonite-responsive transcriptional repressor / arsenate reductase (thioredoxin)
MEADVGQELDGQNLVGRAAVFAALGEPVRLALVDRLVACDASPGELAADVGVGSNLLAHHLRVLEDAGVIRRVRSEGDRRRSYVQLRLDDPTVWAAAISGRMASNLPTGPRVLFVCSANSARSQLAAAIWNHRSNIPATSAGTHPGPRVHPRAVAVAERHGLRIERERPEPLDDVVHDDDLIVVVCDNAHEELGQALRRLHWSIPDPVPANTDAAFEHAYTDINRRVRHLADLYTPAERAL